MAEGQHQHPGWRLAHLKNGGTNDKRELWTYSCFQTLMLCMYPDCPHHVQILAVHQTLSRRCKSLATWDYTEYFTFLWVVVWQWSLHSDRPTGECSVCLVEVNLFVSLYMYTHINSAVCQRELKTLSSCGYADIHRMTQPFHSASVARPSSYALFLGSHIMHILVMQSLCAVPGVPKGYKIW